MAQIHRLPILYLDNSPSDKRIFILMGGGEKVTVGGLRWRLPYDEVVHHKKLPTPLLFPTSR